MEEEAKPENFELYYLKSHDDYQKLEENPENSVLLYFFINDNTLQNLYKKLFTDPKIPMPFLLHEDNIGLYTYEYINYPLLRRRYISDINISIKEGNLESFDTLIYNNNSNGGEGGWTGEEGKEARKKQLFGNLKKSLDKDDVNKLSSILGIDKSVTCDVTCRFFVIGRTNANGYTYAYDWNKMLSRYQKQFEIDSGKYKKVFIGDDFNSYEMNKPILNALLKFDNTNTEIILLPCLHSKSNSNMCQYNNNVISENCSIFQGKNIDTGLYTDFYGDDKVRKPSYIYYSNREHCRDTNIISLVLNKFYSDTNNEVNRIEEEYEDHNEEKNDNEDGEEHAGGRRNPTKKTKKTKKTRKPRKKSRKSRKHKKSRKH